MIKNLLAYFYITLIDIFSKLFFRTHKVYYSILNTEIIKIEISPIENQNLLFGLFHLNSKLVFILRLLILLYIYISYERFNVSFALILLGGLSNFLEYTIFGSNLDFLQINIFNCAIPVFNISDILIVSGFILLCKNNKMRENNV